MEWVTEPTPFATPIFVVWRNANGIRKGRVIADLRNLNKAAVPDNYPLPAQKDIINELRGKKFISVVDASAFFFQFTVHPAHCEKFIIVSHRGLKRSTVALMGFRNSPAYAQRAMDRFLKSHQNYAQCYINNIIIFLDSAEEHYAHLNAIFRLFDQKGISISPAKLWLGYDSVELLGFRVNAFGLANTEERLEAISRLRFPATLQKLESYLGITGFLRSLVEGYGYIMAPLQKRKTVLFRIGRESGQIKVRNPAMRKAYTTQARFKGSPEE